MAMAVNMTGMDAQKSSGSPAERLKSMFSHPAWLTR